MEKVICKKCRSIGYTASPYVVPCLKCGGLHQVMRPRGSIRKSVTQKVFHMGKLPFPM